MASVVALNKSKQMERLTTCPICLEKFRNPKVLPCMHTFCLTPCLTNLLDPRARSLRCPECRREHQIPAGGVQAFPANVTMIGFMDLQPTTTTTTIDLPDRCFICKQQKQTLIKCHDCSQFICTDCREPHLRETFYNISSSVSQLRQILPKISEKAAYNEQRVNTVINNYEQIRREITLTIDALFEKLKHREIALLTEAEGHMQSQLRTFRIQQETAEVELASVASFCASIGSLNPNAQLINDADLAEMRAQCNRYSQQMDALQAQTPTDVQKLRLIFENQAAIAFSIQDFGRLIDASQERQQPRFSSAAHPQTATRYVRNSQNSRNASRQSQNDQHRYLANFNNSRGSTNAEVPSISQTISYRSTQNNNNNNSGMIDDSYGDMNLTSPARMNTSSQLNPWDPPTVRRTTSNVQSSIFGSNPFESTNSRAAAQQSQTPEASPRRNYVTSTTAARSLEGDDRPIFGGAGRGGGGGRGKGRLPSIASIPEHGPLPNNFQRRGTFVLDEPSLPNLPQSGAQRPRDKVNVRELYNVRRRKRARTPVAFTINLNESPPSRASEVIDMATI